MRMMYHIWTSQALNTKQKQNSKAVEVAYDITLTGHALGIRVAHDGHFFVFNVDRFRISQIHQSIEMFGHATFEIKLNRHENQVEQRKNLDSELLKLDVMHCHTDLTAG